MKTRVCVAGATGWTGSLICKSLMASEEFALVAAIARKTAGKDLGVVLGGDATGLVIKESLGQALNATPESKPDVLVDFTKPDSVKPRALEALENGIHVVIGTSGLGNADFAELEKTATRVGRGVIACGNFSVTAALAKRFSLLAAQHLPSWEVIDYAHEGKVDAPSGTTRELAEQLAKVRRNQIHHPVEKTVGYKEARGVSLEGTPVHSVRLPSFVISFETIFGQPHERLTIRHDSGKGAEPYLGGTLVAIRKVRSTKGLVRGLDTLLFGPMEST